MKVHNEMKRFEGATPGAGALPTPVSAARDRVVHVFSLDAAGQTMSIGTGFFIRSNQLVTCAHVIEPAVQIRIRAHGGYQCNVDGVFAIDELRDVAVLWVKDPSAPSPVLPLAERIPGTGEVIYAIGSPRGLPLRISAGQVLAAPEPGADRLSDSVILSAPATAGFSGGPVLDARGEVIGMLGAVFGQDRRVSIAIPAENVAALRGTNAIDAITWPRWLEYHPRPNLEAWQEAARGNELLFSDPQAALMHLEKATAISSNYVKAWVQSGSCLMRMQRHGEAAAMFRRALALEPAMMETRIALAQCLVRQSRWEEAAREFDDVLRRRPDSAQAQGLAALVQLGMSEYDEAFRLARRCVELKPRSFYSQFALSHVCDMSGLSTEALAAYRECVRLAPWLTSQWLRIGCLAYEMGDTNLAADALGRVTKSGRPPEQSCAHYLQALLAQHSGRKAEAQGHLEKVCELEWQSARASGAPSVIVEGFSTLGRSSLDDPATHAAIGSLYFGTRRMMEGVVALEETVRLDTTNAVWWARFAAACADLRRLDKAQKAATRALEIDARSSLAHESLGRTLGMRGQFRDARAEYFKALQGDKPAAAAHLGLAAAEASLGNDALAASHLEDAARLNEAFVNAFKDKPERYFAVPSRENSERR